MHGLIIVHSCNFVIDSKLLSFYCVFSVFVGLTTLFLLLSSLRPIFRMPIMTQSQCLFTVRLTVWFEIRAQMSDFALARIYPYLCYHLLTHYINYIDKSIGTKEICWWIRIFGIAWLPIFHKSGWHWFGVFHHEREEVLLWLGDRYNIVRWITWCCLALISIVVANGAVISLVRCSSA